MPRAILNKSWWQHPTKQRQCSHLPSISKTIQPRRARYVRHCSRNKEELINDFLAWTPSYGRVTSGWPASTYLQQHCTDTGYILEDLPGAMDDRDRWKEKERGRKIHPYRSADIQNRYSIPFNIGGARGVMVIVVGNGHGDTSSNPGRDWLHFT